MMIDTATGAIKLDGEMNGAVLEGLKTLGLTLEALAQPVRQNAPRPKPKKAFRAGGQASPSMLTMR